MSSTNEHSNATGPAIGGLLRLAWQAHRDRLYAQITEAGFADVTRQQFALFRWPSIDGLRPGEVAQLAGLSKQTVNDTLGELERKGYLERHPDPHDRRARVVRLTTKGERLWSTAAEKSLALEAAWAESIGPSRFTELRSTLEIMLERGLPQ